MNLFRSVTRVNTRHCFKYNETIIFAVPRGYVSRSIGEEGKNVRKLSEILGRKIKIIQSPLGLEDAKMFVAEIVSPVSIKDIEITNTELIVNAGRQSKAVLIGRNKRRFLELQKIVKDYFNRDLRII